MDEPTITAYDDDANRTAYLALKGQHKAHPALAHFISLLPENGRVLDLGCGVGAEAAIMQDHGLWVDAVDASQGMVDCARDTHGVDARKASFDDLLELSDLDGVWAHFSLLHAARQAFPQHLNSIFDALRPGGVFYLCMKKGTGERRDGLGRLYTFYQESELVDYLIRSGFEVVSKHEGEGTGLDDEIIYWIMIFGVKPMAG